MRSKTLKRESWTAVMETTAKSEWAAIQFGWISSKGSLVGNLLSVPQHQMEEVETLGGRDLVDGS